jgi:hypothetical protein
MKELKEVLIKKIIAIIEKTTVSGSVKAIALTTSGVAAASVILISIKALLLMNLWNWIVPTFEGKPINFGTALALYWFFFLRKKLKKEKKEKIKKVVDKKTERCYT